jgi:hypothetical protein
METLHNIRTTGNNFRFVLIVAGIVIAIICSLVSLRALNTTEGAETRVLGSMEAPAYVNVNLVVKAASTIGHSVIVFTNE